MSTLQVRLTQAELMKFTTVRSHLVTLVLGTAAVVAIAVAVAAAGDQPIGPAAPEPVALPMEYFAYVAMVLGVLVATSDFCSGTYRVAAGLVPRPGLLLGSKYVAGVLLGLAAAVAVLLLVMVGAALGADATMGSPFASGQWSGHLVSLLVVPVAVTIGISVGALLRSSAAAIALLLLWSLGVETVLVLLLPQDVGAYLPFKTVGASRTVVGELSEWAGFGLFALYAAALAALAFAAHVRRDAPAD